MVSGQGSIISGQCVISGQWKCGQWSVVSVVSGKLSVATGQWWSVVSGQ